jgi:hypothetical protein
MYVRSYEQELASVMNEITDFAFMSITRLWNDMLQMNGFPISNRVQSMNFRAGALKSWESLRQQK